MWIDALVVAALVIGGFRAVRTTRLLSAVIWLAVSSALAATLLYRCGAPEAAVIELSVGAGLVTVLFVFSIATAGEDAMKARALVPPLLAWILIGTAALLLGWSLLPVGEVEMATAERSFGVVMWQERSLDVLVQIGLIFAGVIGVLGLLAEEKADSAATLPSMQQTDLQMIPSGSPDRVRQLNGKRLNEMPVSEKEVA